MTFGDRTIRISQQEHATTSFKGPVHHLASPEVVRAGIERYENKVRRVAAPDFEWTSSVARALAGAALEKIKQEVSEKAMTALQTLSSGTHRDIVALQLALAVAPMEEALGTLDRSYPRLAVHVRHLLPVVLPSIIEGFDESPVHHIAHVVNSAAKIAVGEKLSPSDATILVLGGLFHDCGMGRAELPKISESRIAALPPLERVELRKIGIASRLEHMELGAELARLALIDYVQKDPHVAQELSPLSSMIVRIVREHDLSKIPLMEPDRNQHAKWLLKAGGSEDWLLQLHWEADALWMLTRDGVKVDLARIAKVSLKDFEGSKADTVPDCVAQFAYNLHLHRKIVELYKLSAGTESSFQEYGFPKEGYLYRSKTGRELVQPAVSEFVTLANQWRLHNRPNSLGEPALESLKNSSTGKEVKMLVALAGLGAIGALSEDFWGLAEAQLESVDSPHLDAAKVNYRFTGQ